MENKGGNTINLKLKTKNLKLKTVLRRMDRQFPRHEGRQAISNFLAKKGFTLLEAVVVMGILGIAFGVIMMILTQVVQMTNRAQMANEIRANAVWALNQMVAEVQGGERLVNGWSWDPDETRPGLQLYNSQGSCLVSFARDVFTKASFTCGVLVRDSDCDGGGTFLTTEMVDVTTLEFTRLTENKIRINMTVEQCHEAAPPAGGGRPEYAGKIDLVQEVTLRNYAGYQ